ncbi:lasso RiPP family leader peptide-containing protein [Streptomyces tricolor]|nr:lasso RiPP family leader peptide-containing protein [Streptomyces tricolor]
MNENIEISNSEPYEPPTVVEVGEFNGGHPGLHRLGQGHLRPLLGRLLILGCRFSES